MKATKYQKKSQIKLEDLLRRRKSSLKDFINERGITTYEELDSTCKRLGVLTPSQKLFLDCIKSYISNPTAGVVIVHPAVVLNENTGNPEKEIEDKFENFSPQLSITDVSDNGEVSIILKKAEFVSTQQETTKKRKKRKNDKTTLKGDK